MSAGSNLRTAIVVQARMASTRLPGKVLKMLAGETVLSHVLRRCGTVAGVDVVCCAVPEGADSDPVAAEAARCGVEVMRGSEDDVLYRYLRAAETLGAAVVMRVTSDCPLIDPAICSQVLRLRAETHADYACNNMPPSWPHGLDCEAFTAAALARACDEANTPGEREHVTSWLRTDPSVRRANLPGPGGATAEYRWTLDYPEDLAFLRALAEKLPLPLPQAGWQDCVAVLERHPEIAAINGMRRVVARTELLVDAG